MKSKFKNWHSTFQGNFHYNDKHSRYIMMSYKIHIPRLYSSSLSNSRFHKCFVCFAIYFPRHHKAASPSPHRIHIWTLTRKTWMDMIVVYHSYKFWIFNRNGNVITLNIFDWIFKHYFKWHTRSEKDITLSASSGCRRHWHNIYVFQYFLLILKTFSLPNCINVTHIKVILVQLIK